jgi:hypothetical protein
MSATYLRLSLLSLSMPLLLPIPIVAGDMGPADMVNRNDLPILSEFNAMCVGPMDKWEGSECTVRFTDSRMTVDNSIGVSRDQIKGINLHWGSDVRKYVDVLYATSDNSISLAQFGFRYGNRAKQFVNRLVLFMGGKIQASK